jgi:hypothetical protein
MSDQDQDKIAQEQQGEVTPKLVIAPDDTKSALDFYKHFNIPMPEALTKALSTFAANPTIENQAAVKYEICHAIVHVQHEAFRDEMFKKIAEECASVVYEMKFEKDITETLGELPAATTDK